MTNIDYAAKLSQIGERVKKEHHSHYDGHIEPIPVAVNNPQSNGAPTKERKLCPVTGEPCNSKCKWFRFNKSGRNCPVPEILAVSWKLNNIEIILTAFAKKFLEGFEEEFEQKEK